ELNQGPAERTISSDYRRMDMLEDLGKEMEKIVDTLGTQGIGLSFDEVSILVGDLCQKAQSEVDIWNKLE
ncbi:hypothetical protein KI387_043057, partial [Taxus chinensis]